MAKEFNITVMVTIIRANTLMVCLKALDNIFGLTVVAIKEILSKGNVVDMVYG